LLFNIHEILGGVGLKTCNNRFNDGHNHTFALMQMPIVLNSAC